MGGSRSSRLLSGGAKRERRSTRFAGARSRSLFFAGCSGLALIALSCQEETSCSSGCESANGGQPDMRSGGGSVDPTGSGGETTGAGGGSSGGTGGAPADRGGLLPGSDGYDCALANGAVPSLRLEPYAEGLVDPVLVTHAPADPRLFVVQRDGKIVIVEEGQITGTFLDIESKVVSPADGGFGEKGLLGLAFSPDYARSGLFYVHYSEAATDGDTVVAEYAVSGDPSVADEGSERVVLHLEQPADNHNGGTIVFGPDGSLYIGLGDGGGANDTHQNGQNQQSLLGAILRILPASPSPGEPYALPESGNLRDVRPEAAPEIWASGLRNPYRFNFDACTGDLFIGDVGQDAWEELDIVAHGTSGLNFGWPILEGAVCRPPTTGCDESGFTPPQFAYEHPEARDSRSIVGGAVYRGSLIPALRGQYVFADSYSRQVWRGTFDSASGKLDDLVELDGLIPSGVQLVSAIQNGPDGELYFVALLEGALYRLESR